MANKVTDADRKTINELYFKYKNYAEVARQTGFSPSTVKKYVIVDYKPIEEKDKTLFTPDQIPPFNTDIFEGIDNYGKLCVLSDEEFDEIKQLWKEIEL